MCVKNEKFLSDLAVVSHVEQPGDVQFIKVVKKELDDDEIDFEGIVDEKERPITPIELDRPAAPASPVEAFDWEPLLQLNDKSKVVRRKPKTSFFCSYCFREFNTRAKCLYHERTKHQPKPADDHIRPFTCDRCGLE